MAFKTQISCFFALFVLNVFVVASVGPGSFLTKVGCSLVGTGAAFAFMVLLLEWAENRFPSK